MMIGGEGSRQKNPAVISSPSRPACEALLADRRVLLREATKRASLRRKIEQWF
jgi:hypothetical protein